MKLKVKIGTRKSLLARTQTNWVRGLLEAKGLTCEIVEISTDGDEERTKPLYSLSSTGVFTKQLEDALLEKRVDIAVHSLKDLPTLQPPELEVLAVPTREAVFDVLVVRDSAYSPTEPWGLKPGSQVGTSSLRREALLLSRAKVNVVSVRGNVPTRIEHVQQGRNDAVVLARAGLNRLGWKPEAGLHVIDLDESEFVSAPGQGALGIEGRKDLSPEIKSIIHSLGDPVATQEVRAERHILRQLEGGCSLPLGVRCRIEPSQISLSVFLGVEEPVHKAAEKKQREWRGFHYKQWKGSELDEMCSEAIEFFGSIKGKS